MVGKGLTKLVGFGVVCAGVATLLVFALPDEAQTDPDVEELNSVRATLELSKLRLLAQLDEDGATADQRRTALAHWLSANDALLEREKTLRDRIAGNRAPRAVPVEIPSAEGLTDQEFLEVAGLYLSAAQQQVRGEGNGVEFMNAARNRVSAWRAQPEIKALIAEMDAAHERLDEANTPSPDPTPEHELAALTPLERAEAEAFNVISIAFADELKPGEEGRDRLHQVRHELELWQAEARRLRKVKAASDRDARITELESFLGE